MFKSKFEQLREAREARSRTQKISFAALLVVVVVAFIGCVATLLSRDGDVSEQKQCDDYCMKNYSLKGVLVPIVTNQKTRPGASQGPFKCQCPG